VVVIVARDRPDLFEYLTRGFEHVEGVEVVLDRRITEPAGAELSDAEARDRRWQPDVYDELALRGFVIARFP
jgi:hypothetical protein